MICTCGRYVSGDYCTICDKILIESGLNAFLKNAEKKHLKSKKCKVCKNEFKPNKPLQINCSIPCAIAYTKKLSEVKELKAWKVRKKDLKDKLKTLGEYEQEARTVFQRFIRQRDSGLPCISCGKGYDKADAGHYFKAELYSGLIFNEDNTNIQCVYCNRHLHGNESNYRIGLVEKIGEQRVKWLEENKDRLRQYKYTKEELISIKKKYQQKLKEL